MSDLSARVDAFLAEYFALSPLDATHIGAHAHDGHWPDLTETGRLARAASVDRWETEVRSLDPAGLTPDDSVDRDLVVASGDPRVAAAVPSPRVVGGYGETPGFAYRPYLERLLAHGTPPPPTLRRLVLGDGAAAATRGAVR